MEYLCESYFKRPLEQQLVKACEALRAWDGLVDMPSNPVLGLKRDMENVVLLQRNRELAREVGYRVLDFHVRHPVVFEAVSACGVAPRPWLLGLVDSTYPRDPSAMLVRELTARFVEAGVA